MENEPYDYQKLARHFWATAAKKPKYRGNYGGLFSAMLCVAESNETAFLNQAYPYWHSMTRIGKEEYYTALAWFVEHGYIDYEPGAGQLKAHITLKLPRKQVVGKPTYGATNSRPMSIPIGLPIADLNGLAYTCEPARAEKVVFSNNSLVVNKVENYNQAVSKPALEEGLQANGDENNSSFVPPFVERDRQAARDIAAQHLRDRHPPKEGVITAIEEIWCTIGEQSYTRRAFEELLHKEYSGTKAEIFLRHTGIAYTTVFQLFVEDRALDEKFNHLRHMKAIFEYFAEDYLLNPNPTPRNRTSPKAEPASNSRNIDYGDYEFKG